MNTLTEGKTKIIAKLPEKDVHKQMEVFYNPIMGSNRNISILLLNSVDKIRMRIADPLAGSGIRALRFCKELEKNKIKELVVNDHKENFPEMFKENLKLNGLKTNRVSFHNLDASLFLLQQEGFDYLDLDPFGSPNPFLAAAVARISRGGILAVTATDTAALTGTYPSVTKRSYWARPLRNYLMHEIGLRILIRKIQLQGMQFDKAFVPLLCYHKDHYFRVYVRSEKGTERCDELMKQQQYFLYCPQCVNFRTSIFNKENCDRCGREFLFAGQLWTGRLFDRELLVEMVKKNPFPEEEKFLKMLKEESAKDLVGFYDLHEIAHRYQKEPPKMELVLKRLKAVRTQFSPTGIKTEKRVKEILKVFS